MSQPNTGSLHFRKASRSAIWSMPPKLRWRIERDYQELKQEVGLGHFEGRGWRGFHHHATLCIAAYGFLISERETIPPSGPRSAALLPQLAVPHGYRPRGAPLAAWTAHSKRNRDHAPKAHRRYHQTLATLPMLRRSTRRTRTAAEVYDAVVLAELSATCHTAFLQGVYRGSWGWRSRSPRTPAGAACGTWLKVQCTRWTSPARP